MRCAAEAEHRHPRARPRAAIIWVASADAILCSWTRIKSAADSDKTKESRDAQELPLTESMAQSPFAFQLASVKDSDTTRGANMSMTSGAAGRLAPPERWRRTSTAAGAGCCAGASNAAARHKAVP